MARAGAVWVDVLPNMSRFGSELEHGLVEPVTRAADLAGDEGGEAMTSSMREKVKAGGTAIGLALGVAVADATVKAIEKEKVADRLAAQLGLSGKGAQRAGKIAGSLYSKAVVDSFEDGAEAVRAVMGSGLIPEKATTKSIEAITTRVSDLASTFDQDLAGTANAAAQMIRTGLAKDGVQALDILTKGFQSSANKADDLVDTFNEYGTQFRKLGLDGKTALGVINQLVVAGARDSDLAADALKEFSIRAVDMSQSSQDAYKALGLDAKGMSQQIARGGSSATQGLQTVIDRLRNMKDPVEREAAAVGLFGTQAEDLGKALFALDPSTAVKSLGKVGGAAKNVGDTLRDNTATELEILKRRLTSVFGSVVQTLVLPSINGLITGAKWTASAFAATGHWFQEWGIWLTPLAIIIGGLILALNANAIATAAVTAVFSVYRIAILAGTAVTTGFAGAQALLNSVMALNPITLVVIALVALGAALVIAYKKSETFRAIVSAAWAGIKAAAMAAWTGFLKPMFDGLMVGLRAIGAAAVWLWSALQPVFSAIGMAARILATILVVIVIAPVILAFKALAAIGGWLWDTALGPVFRLIAAGAVILWTTGIKPAFGGAMAILRALGAAGTWLWDSALEPAFSAILAGAIVFYQRGIRPGVSLAMAGLRALGAAGMWLWRTALRPAFSAIGAGALAFYNTGIKPAIDLGKRAIGVFPAAFDRARGAIKSAWSKIAGIAKEPVNFIIDVVYNRGIVGVWNKVAGAFGAPKLKSFRFEQGGILPGYTPGRDPHRFYSPTGGQLDMSGGEAIMRPEWTRAVGPRAVAWMNRLARSGGASRIRQALAPALGGQPQQGQAFADGGIFGWIGKTVSGAGSAVWDTVKKGASWLKDGIEASARAGVNTIVKPLLRSFPGADTQLGKMIQRVPDKMIDSLFGYSKKADKKGGSGGGGKGVGDALSWAKTQAGKAYQWGGNGNPSWDCSGFMSAIESVIRGQKPHRRWATGSFSGSTAPDGWVRGKTAPFMIGITNAGVGHTAGTIRGTNVESRGGDGVVVGPRARGYRDGLFTDRYGYTGKGYANGGRPRPGELAWVGERGPELVRFRGGEEVYDNRTSMALAQGLSLRGFAKGSAAARKREAARVAKARTRARGEVPGDLKTFTKSLSGSASDIKKAANDLAVDLATAGGAGVRLAKEAGAASTKLQQLSKKRDAVEDRIKAAKDYASGQKGKINDFLGLGSFLEAGGASDVITGLTSRQGTVRQFQKQIDLLQRKGLNKSMLGQLIEMGPDSALAGHLSGASAGQIAQLNALSKSGSKLSTGYGNTMADYLFDAGKNAGKGFLTGLMSQEAELQKEMNKLGARMVKVMKDYFGIKSPAEKTRTEVGRPVGAGVIEGMADMAGPLAAQAERMAAAAVPGVPVVPVTAGRAQGGAGGLQPGTRLRLVVGEREMDAYVDDRVDGGLADVRRSKRTGFKD